MTKEELNYIKDAFSQIIDDIAGNPDWYEAARAIASDLGTLERELEKKIAFPLSDVDEAAEEAAIAEGLELNPAHDVIVRVFTAGAEWQAGQGVTAEGEIVKDINNSLAVTAKLEGLEYIGKFGDKVIIQIRRVNEKVE